MGGYHGKTGFDTFSHRRAVAFSTMPLTVATMMSPPFAKRDASWPTANQDVAQAQCPRPEKARKEVAVLIPEGSCESLRVAGVTF